MPPADVVVVGGGVIGCAVAFEAARRGLNVTLVDQPRRGRATSASAGGLWPIGESVGLGCGVIFHRTLGGKPPDSGKGEGEGEGPGQLPPCFFEFALRSNALFPELAEELRESSGMDIEWERTSLLFIMYDEDDESFARTVPGRYPGLGAKTQWLSSDELARAEPFVSRDARGALAFLGDDQVNPYRLADALRAAARRKGAAILSHTLVTGLRTSGGRVTAVETADGPIPCRVVVNAAGAWAAEVGRMAGIAIPVRPVRGQIIGTEPRPRTLSACLSTSDCYLMQKQHGEVIIGSTTEEVGFEAGVTPSALRTLAAGAIRAVPSLEAVGVKRSWSGFRPGTPDQLPILGPVAGLDGYLNACGHFRTGILNAPLTGRVIADLASGVPPSIAIEPFLLARFSPAPAG